MELDVYDRMAELASELYASEQVNETVTAIYQEILSYMQYYSDNVYFISSMMHCLTDYLEHVPEIRQGLFSTILDCIVASTRDHTSELIGPFTSFLRQHFDEEDLDRGDPLVLVQCNEWNVVVFQQLETSGAFDLLLRVGSDLFSYMQFSSPFLETEILMVKQIRYLLHHITQNVIFSDPESDGETDERDITSVMMLECMKSLDALIRDVFEADKEVVEVLEDVAVDDEDNADDL